MIQHSSPADGQSSKQISNHTVLIITQCYKLANNHIKSGRKNISFSVYGYKIRDTLENEPDVKNTAFFYVVFSNFLWIKNFQAIVFKKYELNFLVKDCQSISSQDKTFSTHNKGEHFHTHTQNTKPLKV